MTRSGRSSLRRGLAPALLLAVAVAAAAQTRSLHWDHLDVNARLDRGGALRVTERHGMVFTGDWNGGERGFDVREGQELTINRMVRIDPDGTEHELTRGDLDQVDEYALHDANTLRWRSRLPSDPPFDDTKLEYAIDYTLRHALVPEGDHYALNHDFAFAERPGNIDRLTVNLTIDPPWKTMGTFELRQSATGLPPGLGFTMRVPLAGGRPESASLFHRWRFPVARLLVFLLAIAAAWMMWKRFIGREESLGRLAPVQPPEAIDDKWLNENLLSMRPEVAGAAWDETVEEKEVAAMLARLTAEKKLRSWVSAPEDSVAAGLQPVLHLALQQDWERFEPVERDLIKALFLGAAETDTTRIRAHYPGGFNPATIVAPELQSEVRRLAGTPTPDAGVTPAGVLGFLLGVIGVAICAIVVFSRPAGPGIAGNLMMAGSFLSFMAGVFGGSLATAWNRDVTSGFEKLRRIGMVALVPFLFALRAALLAPNSATGLAITGFFCVLTLMVTHVILRSARTRTDPTRMALRKKLAAGVNFLRERVSRNEPLPDEWFPYVLAFGLTPGATPSLSVSAPGPPSRGVHSTSSSPSSSSTSSQTSQPTFGGGGGAFGGAGASASWAMAASAMAAGVSPPSSSGGSSGGSGGGGGGGSSSGGGSGGGW